MLGGNSVESERVAAGMADMPMLILVGIAVLIAALFYGILGSRIVYPKRIDNTYAWLRGAGTEFWNRLKRKPSRSSNADECAFDVPIVIRTAIESLENSRVWTIRLPGRKVALTKWMI